MAKNILIRKLSYGFGRVGIGFCDFMALIIPFSMLYHFASFMGWIGFWVAGHQRKIALESLTMAFGKDKSRAQIKKIALKCFQTMSCSAIEFFMFMRYPNRIRKYVTVEGLEHLEEALKRGKGVVALSAHFGSFPLLLSRLAQEGYKIHSVLRRLRDEMLDRYFKKKRDGMKVGSIYTQPRQQCVNLSLKALRNNEIVFIQLDQNFGTAGVFVDFFGVKAATATGPIVFSLRTGAPIVPMFIYRTRGPHHKIVIEPMIELDESGERDVVTFDAVARFTKRIEEYIRKYPHEWGWIHKRWKARPKEEKKQEKR